MKIVLTGPESVGKSTLAKQLAKEYNGEYVEEIARSYVEKLNRPYNYEDVVNIVQYQLQQYDQCEKLEMNYFFDTYLIVSKVWFLHVYKKMPSWFEAAYKKRPVDLYLLCKDDLEWEADGVRENENIRSLLFHSYQHELDNYGFNYRIVEGKGAERLINAKALIEEYKKINI
ncbi:AAA family ATPase [Labilibacter marinus]|uniref:AAA family ATPase n=1 Tax=Labilibacter marinus TaxID=1477105 RepID=UPI000836BCFF|nr:ATP-binding protein [Labilibacter marinus]